MDMGEVEGGSNWIPSLLAAAAGSLTGAVGAAGFIQLLRRSRKQQLKRQAERITTSEEESEEEESGEEESGEEQSGEEESGEEESGEEESGDKSPTPKLDRFDEATYYGSRLVCFFSRHVSWGRGSGIVEGKYDGQSVGVKYFHKRFHELVEHEITALKSDSHQNLVRYYCVVDDGCFINLARELATCDLNRIIEDNYLSKMEYGQVWNSQNHYPSLLLLNLMRDIVSGLAHLHQLGIVHHDLRPHHVLIFKDVKNNKLSLCAKLTDMGFRRVRGHDWCNHRVRNYSRSCWQAPEHQPPELDLKAPEAEASVLVPKEFWHGQQKGDIFSLGCILYYCITEGSHPFTDSEDFIPNKEEDRVMNIKSDRKYLSLIESMPEALDLISHLLNHSPDMRPTAQEVLDHPLFWTSNKRLSFLRDACDRVSEVVDPELLNALENTAAATLVGKWDDKFETTFLNSIGGNGSYKFDTVGDLLRLINNTWFICRAVLPQGGSLPEALDDYYLRKFPKLLIEVYKVFCKYCKEEEFFQKYKWSCVI